MKKTSIIALLLIPISIMSLTVNEEEIKTVTPVEFEDYEGPDQIKSTHEQITGIGKNLKKGLKDEKYTWMNKYTMVHAVDPETDKLNADIFIIETKARVDTIYNVRRILAGYLEEAYGYSYSNAFTLATFITYYNAVYRSNFDYFEKKYTKKVLSHLSPDKTGIALSYKEWSGKTSMVIPLSKGDTRLDTTNISDEKVITNVRKTQEDRGVADRKKIVEIKKEDLKEDKKELKTKIAETKKQEKEIAKKEKDLEKKKEQIEKIPDKETREMEQKKFEQESGALKEEKKDLEAKKEEIKQETKDIQAKEEEIKKDVSEIKKDEKINEFKKDPDQAIEELEATKKELEVQREELIKEKESIMKGKLYYLKVKEWEMYGHYDNDMVIIDPATRQVIVRSPVKRIDCSKYLLNEKGVVVILHDDSSPSEHNLALLDKENLTLLKKGKDNVFWRSFIEDRDGFIYVIMSQADSYYLARFTYDLELDKVSTIAMDRDSFISFFEDTIYINRSDKNIIVLDKKDLSMIDEIKP